MSASEPPRRRATSRDVAQAAGVSRATVGFVLNRTPSQTISEPTRRAVLEAAHRLGYVPSAAARALRSGRSRLVLLLLPPWSTTEALSHLARQFALELEALGYVTVTHITTRGAQDVLAATTPAAVVSLAPMDPDDAAHLELLRIPHVPAYVADYPGNPRTMGLPQQLMGATQARHLLERGYDRLVYAEPAEVGFVARVDGRHAGASEVVGSPLPRVRITDDTLDVLVRDWAAGPGRTGVCAFDDRTALEVLAALHRADVDVPGRVGVVGVDDSSAAPFAFPPLSSVRLDLDTQARDLARRTVQTIDGEPWEGLLLRDDGAWVVARSST